jgi:hypothetical protein
VYHQKRLLNCHGFHYRAWAEGVRIRQPAITTLTISCAIAAYAFLSCLGSQACAGKGSNRPFAFQSPFYAVELAPIGPAFARFSVDSLGQVKLAESPLLSEEDGATSVARLQVKNPRQAVYCLPDAKGRPASTWEFDFQERVLTVRSQHVAGRNPPPLQLTFAQKCNHATMLGLVKPGELKVALPAVLHLPDMGSFRVTSDPPGQKLDYDARRWVKNPFVRVGFPAASKERPVVEYRCEVVVIYPTLPGVESDRRFDGFRRNLLNIYQVNPRLAMLANNSSSDTCGFCVFEYAEVARQVPPLAEGLTALDLVRMTVDRHLDGVPSYGIVGYHATSEYPDTGDWHSKYDSLDTYPSLLIAVAMYIEGKQDWDWAERRWAKLWAWANKMQALDTDGNGLIEYPLSGNSGSWARMAPNVMSPANWWDNIGFGHEDAYSNAMAYRAYMLLTKVAERVGKKDDAARLAERAGRIRAAYYATFFNPKTGLLAGWKSKDGKLHDYCFSFVQGLAISYELVDAKQGNAIMDHFLAKLRQVGYNCFQYGLPGNLLPVRQEDYVTTAHQAGGSVSPDGTDGFQIYENGGATPAHVYWTLRALYQLRRKEDARRILDPTLKSFAAGEFQGFEGNKPSAGWWNWHSKDWRTWKGEGRGYEGFLVDGYLVLLAVLDDAAAGQ